MFEINGTLQVQYRKGRNGDFPDGLLLTESGNFRVRDKWLETLEAGEYEGTFVIETISLYTYQWAGFGYPEVRTSIKATISDHSFSDYDGNGGFEDVAVYSDPLDEDEYEDSNDVNEVQTVMEIEAEQDTCSQAEVTIQSLTKSVWKAGEPLKIDSSLSRNEQRQIKALLKEIEYFFNFMDQTWYPKGTEVNHD